MTTPEPEWISISNPDDVTAPPIFEGNPKDAYRFLTPGVYQVDPIDDDEPERQSIRIEDERSYIEEGTHAAEPPPSPAETSELIGPDNTTSLAADDPPLPDFTAVDRADRLEAAGTFWNKFTPELTAAGYPEAQVNAVISDHVDRTSTAQLRIDTNADQYDNRLRLNMMLLGQLGTTAAQMLGHEPNPGTNLAWDHEGFAVAHGTETSNQWRNELTERISLALGGPALQDGAPSATRSRPEQLAIDYVAALPGQQLIDTLLGTDDNPSEVARVVTAIRTDQPNQNNDAAANYWRREYTTAMTNELSTAGYPTDVATRTAAQSAQATTDWMDHARAVNSPEVRLTLLPNLGRVAAASTTGEPFPGTNTRWQLAADIMSAGKVPITREQAEAAAEQHLQQQPHPAHATTTPQSALTIINTSTGVLITAPTNDANYSELAEHLDANHFQPVIDQPGTWTMPTPETSRTRTNFRLTAIKAIVAHLGLALREPPTAAPSGQAWLAAPSAPAAAMTLHPAAPQR